MKDSGKTETEAFEAEATRAESGWFREAWDFLRTNKKWWLLPILLVLLLMGAFVFLGTTGAAPFLYPFF